MAKTDSIRYQETVLAKDVPPIRFSVKDDLFVPCVEPKHPFYREQHETFDLDKYMYPRMPIELGNSELSFDQITESVNVLRTPIKFPGTAYLIPQELKAFFPLIRRVAEYEAGVNQRHDDCCVHITIDKSTVKEGETHRYPGFHGDGVQGAKFSQKSYLPIEHSYILTSSPPTEFCIQPFFFRHLNDAKHNIFHEMELQVRECNIYKTLPWHLYLIDPYMVHRTPTIKTATERLFVRITYAYSELLNPHNTVNPHFGEQEYEPRHDIRKFLTTYPADVPWNMYGFSSGPARG
jgi:hypothetical protein